MRTYTKFANALSDQTIKPETVWENIAFYNYCQMAVSHNEEDPETEDYKASEEAFINLLRMLKPDVVVCWSYNKVYMHTPSNNWTSPENGKLGYYTFDGVNIPMFAVTHPAYIGYSPAQEHETIAANLKKLS